MRTALTVATPVDAATRIFLNSAFHGQVCLFSNTCGDWAVRRTASLVATMPS
jgi:hypothetical protein